MTIINFFKRKIFKNFIVGARLYGKQKLNQNKPQYQILRFIIYSFLNVHHMAIMPHKK